MAHRFAQPQGAPAAELPPSKILEFCFPQLFVDLPADEPERDRLVHEGEKKEALRSAFVLDYGVTTA